MPQPTNGPARQLNQATVQQSQNAALNQWTGNVTWPGNYYLPQQVWTYPAPAHDKYANEVTVELGEHDATLIFRRKSGRSLASEVTRVTIPKALGEAMVEQFTAKKKGRR